MGTNPMNQEGREALRAMRLEKLRRAARCLARTRAGTHCQCPAVRGRQRCRLHGGAPGTGAPPGERNGAYTCGSWTTEAIEMRRSGLDLLRRIRSLRAQDA